MHLCGGFLAAGGADCGHWRGGLGVQPPLISNPQVTEDRFRFDALTADNATTDVEYTDTAAGQWQVLTNLSAFGGFTNVVDPAGVSVVTQRFYRLNLRKN